MGSLEDIIGTPIPDLHRRNFPPSHFGVSHSGDRADHT